jgi:hypothetical protein
MVSCTQVQLEIVDEAEECAAALGMEIVVGSSNNLGSRQTANRRASGAPGFAGGHGELKRGDSMPGVGVVTRHTIGR